MAAAHDLITAVLPSSDSIVSSEQVSALLPEGVDGRLRTLISGIIAVHLHSWREASIEQRVSLPRLLTSGWSVDVINATEDASRLGAAAVTLKLEVREQPRKVGEMPALKTVHTELNHASLTVLVEGMRKIRDQLSSLG